MIVHAIHEKITRTRTHIHKITDGLIWLMNVQVRSISKEQVELLQAPLDSTCKKNARPLQELNGRQIELYAELGDS